MQDTIRFLERLGQDVAVGHHAYAALLEAEVVGGVVREALRERDVAALNDVFGSTAPWFCMVATPDGEEVGRPEEILAEDEDEDEGR